MAELEFKAFPKIPRLSKEIVITEKIDGTNAQIFITEDGDIFAGSRNRWITPENDNYGFAKWVKDNKGLLVDLGPGHHYGEWWGRGIQRRYNQDLRHFSLFNTSRWNNSNPPPECCLVVPVLYTGPFSFQAVEHCMKDLKDYGSRVADFDNPEGVVVYHTQANQMFKKTFENDEGKWNETT
jgi:hypothetical protein